MSQLILTVTATAFALGAAAARLSAQSPSSEQARRLAVHGVQRTYLLHVPASLDRTTPAPLVLVLHGAGGRGAGFARHTGFSELAEERGFIAVYPDGIRRRWNDGRSAGPSQDDVGFIRSLLDTLKTEFAIDTRRIYATGISNGAMFSYRLACDLPGVFAAIAPVAGALPAELAPRCTHAEPIAIAAFQGTADSIRTLYGRRGGPAQRPSALGRGDHDILGESRRLLSHRHNRARAGSHARRRHPGAALGVSRVRARSEAGALYY